jgi:hypothetical protein
MPAMRPNIRSSGVATAVAIVSALAPGRFANTVMVGYSTSGRRAMGESEGPIHRRVASPCSAGMSPQGV